MKRRLLISLMLGLVIVGSAACTGKQTNNQQFIKVTRGDLAVTVSGSGNLEVANDATVTFRIGGRITNLYVKEADHVTKGTVLAKLDDKQLQLALTQARYGLAQAELAVQTAQLDLNKTTDTYKWPDIQVTQSAVDDAKSLVQYDITNMQNATSPGQAQQWAAALISAQIGLANAEAKLKAQTIGYDTDQVAIKKAVLDVAYQSVDLAQQTLVQAQEQIDDTTITAPIDGVVTKVVPKEEDTITPLTPVVTILDLKSIRLKAAVDEVDIPSVKVGQPVTVTVDALPGMNIPAKVTAISDTSAVQSGVVSYNVTVSFVNDMSSLLKIGMSATADIVVQSRQGVLLVPNRAVQQDSQSKQTVKVQVGTLIQDRQITTGITDGVQTEVASGLQEGDTVVITTKATTSSGGLFGG